MINFASVIYDLSSARNSKTSADDVLFVCKSETEAKNYFQVAQIIAPNLSSYYFPSWDCLPFDRISPGKYVMSQRTKTLSRLSSSNSGSLIFTYAKNLLQKLPPKEAFKDKYFVIEKNKKAKVDDIANILVNHGFIRNSSAMDSGEFAQKGEIFDIVVGENEAYRLIFGWDKIEDIKILDPLSQISSNSINKFEIYPTSEMNLDEKYIEHFRGEFLKLFSVNNAENPIYQAICDGICMSGAEHLTPLLYPEMSNLLDYLKNPQIVFDPNISQTLDEEYESISELHHSRDLQNKANKSQFYPLLPIDRVFEKPKLIQSKVKKQALNYNSSQYEPSPDFYSESLTKRQSVASLAKAFLKENHSKKIFVFAPREAISERISNILSQENVSSSKIEYIKSNLPRGFITDDAVYFRHRDFIGEKRISDKESSAKRLKNILGELETYEEGDLIVHQEHGIGKFIGIENITANNIRHDFIKLVYFGDDKLYIPVENIDLIKKYGTEEAELDRLGSVSWQRRKAKLKERIGALADKLIKIAAERKFIKLPPIFKSDSDNLEKSYEKFSKSFPYTETEDQQNAIDDIEKDLSLDYPMDRMICGDVGFGKTEVAMRGAYLVANSKKQVAIIAPTTILARQHYNSFVERFRGTDLNIGSLSRLTLKKNQGQIIEDINNGKIDIIIGTHALLNKKIKFKNLGMMIIDEEHHFGVVQKERLKELKSGIHVLTLSATPIPRSLQMSVLGIKDLSLIATPPIDRMPVKTNIIPNDSVIIRDALIREKNRGGRSFYVAPRIKDLHDIELELQRIAPELSYVVAHGQMKPTNIDRIMGEFYDGKYDILLCTTIVESGIDIQAANTMIIHRAEMLGLAQLYQLRGRIGRGKIRGFAYLVVGNSMNMTNSAAKRLEILENINTLGAGFTIASYDSDLRGFGNLLGDEQSGHIKEVGAELYQDMLEKAIQDLGSKKASENISTNININLPVFIPNEYIEDSDVRLGIYKRISMLNSDDEVENFRDELIDRFGKIPDATENLLALIRVKCKSRELKIKDLDSGPNGILLEFIPDEIIAGRIIKFAEKNKHIVKLRPDNKLFVNLPTQQSTILNTIYDMLDAI